MTFNVGDFVYFESPDYPSRTYGTVIDKPNPYPDHFERISVQYESGRTPSWPMVKYLHLVTPAGPDEIEEMFS